MANLLDELRLRNNALRREWFKIAGNQAQ